MREESSICEVKQMDKLIEKRTISQDVAMEM